MYLGKFGGTSQRSTLISLFSRAFLLFRASHNVKVLEPWLLDSSMMRHTLNRILHLRLLDYRILDSMANSSPSFLDCLFSD